MRRTWRTLLRRWSTGCGFPCRTRTFSFRAPRPEGPSNRPTGRLWPSGLISRMAGTVEGSRSVTGVFTEVVVPAGAARGTASGRGGDLGWARLDVNRKDPVEMALALDTQRSALAVVAESSAGKYTGQFNRFVSWCDALAEPRASLPASDATVALNMQSLRRRHGVCCSLCGILRTHHARTCTHGCIRT